MLLHNQGCSLFQSLHFRNVLQEVQRRFCVDSKSKKLNPKHPSKLLSVINIHPDDMAIPFGCPSVSKSFELLKVASVRTSQQHVRALISVRHKIEFPGKTVAYIQTSGLHRLDAILDKARRGEELQPSRRQGNTVRTLVLIMEFTYSRSTTVWTLGQ
jgi:hypothetical protein